MTEVIVPLSEGESPVQRKGSVNVAMAGARQHMYAGETEQTSQTFCGSLVLIGAPRRGLTGKLLGAASPTGFLVITFGLCRGTGLASLGSPVTTSYK